MSDKIIEAAITELRKNQINIVTRQYVEHNEAKENLAKFGALFIKDLTRKNGKIKGQYLDRKLHRRAVEFGLINNDGYASKIEDGIKEAVEKLTK